jgi:hypothetical protein
LWFAKIWVHQVCAQCKFENLWFYNDLQVHRKLDTTKI